MELVYLWVEDYKNIHRQGFNFSPKFNCEFDGENLTIKNNPEYIENFFGDNINVTAIVGKNGSGKSSLLEYFLELDNYLPHHDEYYNESAKKIENFISIFIINDKLYYMSNIQNIKSDINKNSHIPFIRTLSYSHCQDINDSPKDLMFGDIFLNKDRIISIIKAIYMSKFGFEFYPSHRLLKNDGFELSTFLYLPIKIEITPKELKEVYNWNIGMFLMHAADNDRIELANNQQKLFDTAEDDYHRFLISIYLGKDEATYDLNILSDKKQLESEYIKLNFKEFEKITENDYFKYFSTREINFKDISDYENFIYFGEEYSKFFDYDLIDKKNRRYNNLSNGEQTLFGIILHIYYKLNLKYNYQEEDEPLIFCLDEPDISLHPQWQKKYINEILSICKQFDKKIHLMITTHSPFLLSDIPKQNIIFLDTYKEKDVEVKEEKQEVGNCRVIPHDEVFNKKQTFGANIHTLLSDSFFMEGGLMGEFAKEKINEIIKFHKDVEEIKDNESARNTVRTKYEIEEDEKPSIKTKFWNTQSIIGDEYLKQVIKNHLVDMETILLGKDGAKEEEIRRLRTEADRLENLS